MPKASDRSRFVSISEGGHAPPFSVSWQAVAAPARDTLPPAPRSTCSLPTPWAVFTMHGFVDPESGKEHVALALGDLAAANPRSRAWTRNA